MHRFSTYYYIFDSRTGRPCITERVASTTRSDRAQKALVRYVIDKKGEKVGRAFACWGAKQTWHSSPFPESCIALWEAGREQATAHETDTPLRSVRETYQEKALWATTVGLPAQDPAAAQLLAAWACTEPTVEAAIHDMMHMGGRWAEFAHSNDPDAAQAMEKRYQNALLDVLGSSTPLSLFS